MIGETVKKKGLKLSMPSFVATLAQKKKVANNQNTNKTNKNWHSPSILARLISIYCDLCLSYAIMSYSYSFESVNNTIKGLEKVSSFLISLLSLSSSVHVITSLVALYIIFHIYKIYTSLFLGVSLGQYIVGIRGPEGFIWKRVAGPVRELINFICSPFLILQLPILFGRPSIIELASGAELKKSDGIFGIKLSLLFVPLCTFLLIISPLFENMVLIDGIKVKFTEEKQAKLSNDLNFSKFKNYHSNYFHLSSFTSLDQMGFKLIPSFEVTREGSKKVIRPILNIFDMKNGTQGVLRIGDNFSLLEKIQNHKNFNPKFGKNYPVLNSVLKSKEQVYDKFSKRTLGKDEKVNFLLPSVARDQIENLLKDSFKLGVNNIWSHILKNGVYVRSYLSLRSEFMSFVSHQSLSEVNIVNMGDNRFFKVKQRFEKEFNLDKQLKEIYIPIETENSLTLIYSWEKGNNGKDSMKRFKENFLTPAKWSFDYNGVNSLPKIKEAMDPFHILDFFSTNEIEFEQSIAFEEYVYHYYFDLAKNSIESDNKALKETLISSLNRLELVADLKNKKKKNYYSTQFIAHLKSIKKGIQSNDKLFFGL